MTDIVWQTADSAPQPVDNYTYSNTFLAVISTHPDEPFPCRTRDGKFYDTDCVDRDGEWVEVDAPVVLWAEIPKPSAEYFKAALEALEAE